MKILFLISFLLKKYEGDDAGTDQVKQPLPDPYVVEKSAKIHFKDLEADLQKISKNLKGKELLYSPCFSFNQRPLF